MLVDRVNRLEELKSDIDFSMGNLMISLSGSPLKGELEEIWNMVDKFVQDSLGDGQPSKDYSRHNFNYY
jgi:hypothetical protein